MNVQEIKRKYFCDILGQMFPFKVYAVVINKNGNKENKVFEIKTGGFHNKVQKKIVESNAIYKAKKDGIEVLEIKKIEPLDKDVVLH